MESSTLWARSSVGTFSFPTTVTVECDFQTQQDGTYVEFEPSGRTDEGNLRLTSSSGDVINIGCLATTDQFLIYPSGQQVAWGQHRHRQLHCRGPEPMSPQHRSTSRTRRGFTLVEVLATMTLMGIRCRCS